MGLSDMKLQATSISLDGKAYLITGRSGVGKSSLALALIQRGATLISDDITAIREQMAIAPENYRGWLEVRGIGLISGFTVCNQAPIAAEIRLSEQSPERLPQPQQHNGYPCFELWEKDPNLADKVLVIHRLLNGQLKKEY